MEKKELPKRDKNIAFTFIRKRLKILNVPGVEPAPFYVS